jgi:hypothetical protein
MDHDADALMEHCFSSPTPSIIDTSDEMSTEEPEGVWFSKLTKSLKYNIPAVIDGVANTIHRSARTLINEFSELENQAMRDRSGTTDSHFSDDEDMTVLPLPWELFMEVKDENSKLTIVEQEDDLLKEKVLALSHAESTFTGPFADKTEDLSFAFGLDNSRVVLIRQLLEIDENLGKIHAKLSGRSEVEETLFWKNYFYHCGQLRAMREEELKKEHLRRTSYDKDLDAELVGRPPASCTGFYPRTGGLQAPSQDGEDQVLAPPAIGEADSFVIVDHDSS